MKVMSFTTEIWTPITATSISNTDSIKTETASKTSMPSSALPRTAELRQEDDWTKVKDPKEKKRIQNRVAQRTYRHRMKARLGELQARLESHEARRSQSADAVDTATLSQNPTTNPDGSISPTVGALTDKPDMLAQHSLPPHFMQQPNLYEQPVDDPENSLFPQIAHHGMLSSPPPSHSSPTAHGLLSPPTQTDQTQDPRTGKNSQDFMVDCLRFQSQLLSRLNNLQQETGFPTYQNTMSGQMSAADQATTCVAAFPNPEGMEFATFDGSVDMWKPDGMKMQQASPDSTYFSNITPTGSSTGIGTGLPAALGVNSMQARKPHQNATLDERFQCIMEQVDAAGFESFDAMATAYYTQNFNDTSPLADEQRLSRNRRLPQFISEVNAAASKGWSDWERKGFQDEILRTAEGMLTNEGCDARQSLGGKVTQLVEAQDNGNPAAAAEAMLSIKRTVQEQLPNSWALTMALASDNRHSWQSDRSNTALATTLLLNFAGRISNDQLLRLVSSCL